MFAGALAVAKKKAGRPREPKPLKSLLALRGTEDLEAWIDEFVDFVGDANRANLVRNAMRCYAEREGFAKPLPKR
jgi:hypothetical protein